MMFDNYEFVTKESRETNIEFEVGKWVGIHDISSVSKVTAYFPGDFVKEYIQNNSKVTWLQKFDLIIIGPCSFLLDMMRGHSYLENAPFGKMPDLKTCIIQDILDSCKKEIKEVKSVLLIPRCCGKYSYGTQDDLAKYYPKVYWIYLDTELHNFEDDTDSSNMIQSIVDEGIISLTSR